MEKGIRDQNSREKANRVHEKSDIHREAVARYIVAPSHAMEDIIEIHTTLYASERQHNRKMAGVELNSNFHQLMLLRPEEDTEILDWLKKIQFMSPKIPNEMIEVLALGVLREISANIQIASIYTILADESADVSNKEQVVVCIRWVDDELCVHEEFIGIKPVERTCVEDIVKVLCETLNR